MTSRSSRRPGHNRRQQRPSSTRSAAGDMTAPLPPHPAQPSQPAPPQPAGTGAASASDSTPEGMPNDSGALSNSAAPNGPATPSDSAASVGEQSPPATSAAGQAAYAKALARKEKQRRKEEAKANPTPARRLSKHLFLIVGVGVVLGLIFAAVAYIVPIFRVSEVAVSGTSKADPVAVQEASGVQEGQNIVRVKTGEAATRVVTVPWVASATVTVKYPHTVSIDIVEHQPVAFYRGNRDNPGTFLVDAEGRVVVNAEVPAEPQPVRIVELTGVKPEDQTHADVQAAAAVLRAIEENDPGVRNLVERVDVRNPDDITVFFPEGREVYWGTAEHASDKAEATRVVLAREGQRWNVSNPNIVTLRP